jgi:hypothetical protein
MTALLPSLLLTWLFEAGEEGDAGVDLPHDGLDLPHDLLVALLLDHPEAQSIGSISGYSFSSIRIEQNQNLIRAASGYSFSSTRIEQNQNLIRESGRRIYVHTPSRRPRRR